MALEAQGQGLKPCRRCGGTERNTRGDCAACAREHQRKLRREKYYQKREPSKNPCTKCGGTERYKKGDCKTCAKQRIQEQYRLRTYGVTPEAFNRMLEKQGGWCAICREQKATHLDHSHATGKVRGILCLQCNTALGSFRDSEKNLMMAINYLRSA